MRLKKKIIFLIRSPSSLEALAVKAISRSSIEQKNTAADAYHRIWFERDVLLAPFFVGGEAASVAGGLRGGGGVAKAAGSGGARDEKSKQRPDEDREV